MIRTMAVAGLAFACLGASADIASARPGHRYASRHHASRHAGVGTGDAGAGEGGAGLLAGTVLGFLGQGIAGASDASNGHGHYQPSYGQGYEGFGSYGPGYGYYGY